MFSKMQCGSEKEKNDPVCHELPDLSNYDEACHSYHLKIEPEDFQNSFQMQVGVVMVKKEIYVEEDKPEYVLMGKSSAVISSDGYNQCRDFDCSLVSKSEEVAEYNCVHCAYKTNTKSDYSRHCHCKHNQSTEVYKCNKCPCKTGVQNDSAQHFKYNNNKHLNEAKVYKCVECSFQTRRKYNLILHHRVKHSNKEVYKCDECLFETRIKNVLIRHQRKMHLEQGETLRCNKCSYEARNKNDIAQHKIQHSNLAETYRYDKMFI